MPGKTLNDLLFDVEKAVRFPPEDRAYVVDLLNDANEEVSRLCHIPRTYIDEVSTSEAYELPENVLRIVRAEANPEDTARHRYSVDVVTGPTAAERYPTLDWQDVEENEDKRVNLLVYEAANPAGVVYPVGVTGDTMRLEVLMRPLAMLEGSHRPFEIESNSNGSARVTVFPEFHKTLSYYVIYQMLSHSDSEADQVKARQHYNKYKSEMKRLHRRSYPHRNYPIARPSARFRTYIRRY